MRSMALYLIGDVQGCDAALQRLLQTLDFSPSRDQLVLLGDLVNRGPDSLAVLRRMQALDGAARCLLGNHDLHLLALAHGVRRPQRSDTLAAVLQAPDREALLDWLRRRPLALLDRVGEERLLMVHAGVLPQWSAEQALALAQEVQAALGASDWGDFLHQMYGNEPAHWDQGLQGVARLRLVVNTLTRLRFCRADGSIDFSSKDGAGAPPPGCLPWYAMPERRTASVRVAFGHWSTLGWLGRSDVLSLDTGCVWGGCLSALRVGWDQGAWTQELLQVACPQAQQPGQAD